MSEPARAGRAFDPDQYDALLAGVRARFDAVCAAAGTKLALLVTGATDLFQTFLAALPADQRQAHTCSTCRGFIARFGSTVYIDDDGNAHAALWDPAGVPAPFVDAVRALAKAVTDAPVIGVLVTRDRIWGAPCKGARGGQPWHHLAVAPPAALIHPGVIHTPDQVAAERREDRAMLQRGLDEFPPELVRKAVALLQTEQIDRAEKCLGTAKWMLEVHALRARARGDRRRDNLMWRAAATAPPGFCRVRSTMIGTLLEDLASELAFDAVKARFEAKMHPLRYQRPAAAPSAANLERAEQILAQLATAGALERRFAKLADVVALWKPAPPTPPADPRGVFTHLKPLARPQVIELDTPATVITWEKFARIVLPHAARITFRVPAARAAYMGLVTAANPDAPPILQWDSLERRNPVSSYIYTDGSLPTDWNLRPGVARMVTAITLAPAHWYGDGPAHHAQFALFILDGARDLRYAGGAGFFPEILRSEYHPIRKTMEAYARTATIAGKDDAEACGIVMWKGRLANLTFRVTSKDDVVQTYRLDRWD